MFKMEIVDGEDDRDVRMIRSGSLTNDEGGVH